MTRYLTLLVYVLTVFSPVAAEDWAHWGGPNANFKLSVTDAFPQGDYALRVAWKRRLGTGYSSVSVAHGLAITMYSDGENDFVIALDANDGSDRWRYTIGPAYLGHWGSQSGPLSTPLITDHSVIALSPRGRLFALGLTSGKQIWSVDLVETQGGRIPFWGFTTSPRLIDDRLIVQTGGSADNAISAYDANSGSRLWSAGTDSVDYQSHGIFQIGEDSHLIFHGNNHLIGLDPESGSQRWSFSHEGAYSASSTSSHPVEIDEGQYFVKNSGRGGVLVSVSKQDDGYVAKETWRTRNIGGTYMYPIYHDGILFGYKGRILTALDATNGERIWRSRDPGDGLPLIIDDHLVTITKEGKLAIAPVSRVGYQETASLQVFNDIVWSPACFANSRFYVRSMSKIASVEVVPSSQGDAHIAEVPGIIPATHFAGFIDELSRSQNKAPLIDRLLKENASFPIVEGDNLAHFVYIGEADEVAITGDHIGRRIDIPMHNVEGTDLYYYSSRLESDARITYRFTIDLQKNVTDPRNPNEINSLFFGKASWFGMPKWEQPAHLSGEVRHKGKMGTVAFVEAAGDTHQVKVYLPPNYDADTGSRYPVTYMHDVRRPFSTGRLDDSLDRLIDRGAVSPTLVVVVPAFAGGGYRALVGSARRDDYTRVFVEELIPYIDGKFKTIHNRQGRANFGTGRGGFIATYASFRNPDLFGGIAVHSTYWDQTSESEKATVIPEADALPAYRIYLDWGRYDARSPIEGNDTRRDTERFAKALKDRGHDYVGGMVNDGAGWASWRNRFDQSFGALFPAD
jgi:enterochelin esterase-like enzyme/outer membrane protein assembly factor BamB